MYFHLQVRYSKIIVSCHTRMVCYIFVQPFTMLANSNIFTAKPLIHFIVIISQNIHILSISTRHTVHFSMFSMKDNNLFLEDSSESRKSLVTLFAFHLVSNCGGTCSVLLDCHDYSLWTN